MKKYLQGSFKNHMGEVLKLPLPEFGKIYKLQQNLFEARKDDVQVVFPAHRTCFRSWKEYEQSIYPLNNTGEIHVKVDGKFRK